MILPLMAVLVLAGTGIVVLFPSVGCEVAGTWLGEWCRKDIPGALPRSSPPAEAMAPVPGKPCAPRAYPAESLRAGEEGRTLVGYRTGPDGTVIHAEVVTSSGHARLDAASVAHVKTCRFQPDVSHGRLLEKWTIHGAPG